jgi:hypothetical protein
VYLNLFFPAFLVLYLYAHLLSPKRSKRGEEVLHVTLRSVLKKDIYYCHDLEPAKVAFRYCSLIKKYHLEDLISSPALWTSKALQYSNMTNCVAKTTETLPLLTALQIYLTSLA